VQQSDAKTRLQLPHRVAERRGCNAEMQSRSPEAETFGYRDKRAQISEIGTAHR